jgi:hypothetical protein
MESPVQSWSHEPDSTDLMGIPSNIFRMYAFASNNEDAQQAAPRNADSACSLSEFRPSVGVFSFCIVVYV